MPYCETQYGRLYYSHWSGGDDAATRPPLLLVHGAGETRLSWPPRLRRLGGGPVYALDLPAHGKSQGRGLTQIAGYRDVVQAFVQALALPPFVLAGHSMGGAIVLSFARAFPYSLAGLVLVSTGAVMPVSPHILNDLLSDFSTVTERIVRWAHAPDSDEAYLQQALARLRQNDPELLWGDFVACNEFDLSDSLPGIRLPTLILCGAQDKMTPLRYSRSLQEHLPHSRLQVVEGAGHMVQLEQPESVIQQIQAFLDQVGDGKFDQWPD